MARHPSNNKKSTETPGGLQRDLFEITTGRSDTPLRAYANVLELWDLLPKYDVWGHAKRYHQDIDIHDRVRIIPVRHKSHRDHLISDEDTFIDLELHIEPALIRRKVREWVVVEEDGKKKRKRTYLRDKDGNYILEPCYVYPGLREDKVEEALRYLLAHGQGSFAPEKTGVAFSVKQIQRELKRTGSSLSVDEIKESLEVLSRARCEIYGIDSEKSARSVMGSNYLPSLVMVNRDDFQSRLASGEDTHCYAQFHLLVTMGISHNLFRMTNYATHQRLDNLFSRFLHKLLRTNFVYASEKGAPYRLSTNRAMKEFGREVDRQDNTRTVVLTAIKDLMKHKIVERYIEEEPERSPADRRIVLDRTYLLYPTKEFVSEIIAANAEHKKNREILDDFRSTEALAGKSGALSQEEDLVRKELVGWSIPIRRALNLIETHSLPVIRRCLRETRTRHESGSISNPSGFILKALEEGWFQDGKIGIGADGGVTAEDSVEPDEKMMASLSAHVRTRIMDEWNTWTLGEKRTFNKYGPGAPHVRELLERTQDYDGSYLSL